MSVKFRLLSSLCTAFLMSMCMSCLMTVVNVGFGERFLAAWLRGWAMGFCVALPLSYFLPPRVQALLRKLGVK